jgi:hypothetical protein
VAKKKPEGSDAPAGWNRGDYAAHKSRVAARDRAESQAGREIGPLPEIVDPDRRNRGLDDPEFFHRTYFPNRFYLGFGTPHRLAIRTLSQCTESGGLFAFAMARGSGKTSLAECEVIRAIVYGLRRYVVFLGATDPLADRAVQRIFREFEMNDLLAEDFPEIGYPVRRLERINQRAKGQTLNGEHTLMQITDGAFVLPTVPGSPSSGAVVQSFGITGALKGLNVLTASGTPIRPDLVILDDCQTRESAKSPTQTADRERIVCDDVLGLAGPRTKMAAVFLCTPIYPGDLTERFIDRDKHPEWRGVRTKMIEAFPSRRELWDTYHEMRRESLRDGDEGRRATEFYQRNRSDMDYGCVLSWPDRIKEGDISGVQTAMNLYLDNPIGFLSEYQCEPEHAKLGVGSKELAPDTIMSRLNGHDRGVVPNDCTRLTAFIDVGGEILWYAVCGWNESFGGAVIDYGTWPRQNRSLFLGSDPRPSISDVLPARTSSQRVYAALEALLAEIASKQFATAAGATIPLERILVDAGWGETSDAVRQCVVKANAKWPGLVLASKGVGRSTSQAGVAKWAKRPGERSGYHWKITVGEPGRGRLLLFDPDSWKTQVHGWLTVPLGGSVGVSLCGTKPGAHELFAEHCSSEYSQSATLRGETFDKWQARPDKPDNHWWDCLVGCAVAASVSGAHWAASADHAETAPRAQSTPRKKPSELQRERLKARGM